VKDYALYYCIWHDSLKGYFEFLIDCSYYCFYNTYEAFAIMLLLVFKLAVHDPKYRSMSIYWWCYDHHHRNMWLGTVDGNNSTWVSGIGRCIRRYHHSLFNRIFLDPAWCSRCTKTCRHLFIVRNEAWLTVRESKVGGMSYRPCRSIWNPRSKITSSGSSPSVTRHSDSFSKRHRS
jgi:hypothetical protein